jgi:hypothetical protein
MAIKLRDFNFNRFTETLSHYLIWLTNTVVFS